MPALRNLLDRTARAWQLPLPGLLRQARDERAPYQGASGGHAAGHQPREGRSGASGHSRRGQAQEGGKC